MLKPDGTFQQDIQCIVPQMNGKGAIYISNLQAASNPSTLKKNKIGAVITAIRGKNLSQIIPKHLQYFYIPVVDHQSCDISLYFKDSYQFIDQQRKRTNILVHCMAGVSRSVTLVIAYIMQKSNINYQTAYNYVKSKRNIIHPNQSFIQQLKKLETILKTKPKKSHTEKQHQSKSINNIQNKIQYKQKQKQNNFQLKRSQLQQLSNHYVNIQQKCKNKNNPSNDNLSKSIYLSTGGSSSFYISKSVNKPSQQYQYIAQQKLSYSRMTSDQHETNQGKIIQQNSLQNYNNKLRQNIRNLFNMTKSQIKLIPEQNKYNNKVYR